MSDSNLVSRVSDALLDARDGDLLSRVPRGVQRAIECQNARALVHAARVQGDAYVAHARVEAASFVARIGMHRVAELSAEAMEFSGRTPLATGRFQAIADAYASIVAEEVIKLGYDR